VARQVLVKLPNVKFIWAGDGSLMDECQTRVNKMLGIQFIGHQNNVEKLYKQATVYFQPSLIESHGIATLGAMYHGIPCVVSNNGGLKESVEHGVNGYLVADEDVMQAAIHILDLLQQPNLCKEMGAAGRNIYNDLFTKGMWIKRMSNLFQ
jgi:glycosyltransferase involved in cell wall biosynthesis